jgi:pSer/pThr/pTyr-binding forkhead associated (FHA) protein
MPKLIINERGQKEEWTHECLEEAISIGRLEENMIALPTQGVSRQHAKIIKEADNYFLIDLGSGNGTMLNGTYVEPNEKHLLRNNDLITIDTFDLRFYMTDEALERSYNEEITDSDILEVKLLKKVLKALDKETVPSLEVLNGVAEGKKIFFADDMSEMVIGRDPSCEFPVNEFVISRKHAKVMKRWGGIVIRDLESKNGTFINNRRIVEEFLHDGDRIALGTIVFLFRNPQEINLAQLTEKIPPKRTPAQVKPQDIPMPKEEVAKPEAPAEEIPEIEEPAPQEGEPQEAPFPEEVQEFEERAAKKMAYPLRLPKLPILKRLSPVEIGMVGLGVLVLIFAFITVVNLIFE